MASLTLKNLPDGLLTALRAAANRDKRSLSQEILYLLEIGVRDLDRRSGGGTRAEEQVAAWRKLAGKWKSDVDQETETTRILARRTKGRRVDL